jgi:hypothetical protein
MNTEASLINQQVRVFAGGLGFWAGFGEAYYNNICYWYLENYLKAVILFCFSLFFTSFENPHPL